MCTAHSDPSSVRHGPGPCIPPRCPTACTSVVPMVPFVRCLGAGSCPAISPAPKDHLTRLCDSVRPASSQVQGHPPHSSEGSRCPCLVRGITVLLAKDVMEPVMTGWKQCYKCRLQFHISKYKFIILVFVTY